MVKGKLILDGYHNAGFTLDRKYETIFVLIGIGGCTIGDMDDQTLGHFDPMTLLEVSMP